MIRTLSAMIGAAFVAGCSVVGIRSGYEQPAHEVVGTIGDDIEIRRYAERLAAEITVDTRTYDGDPAQVAFRALAGYIFGGNRARTEIAMTARVEAKSLSIAMTAPVEAAAGGGTYRLRFYLPAELTLETAPEPDDERVTVVPVPAETVAVLRFTGLRDETRTAQNQQRLLRRLDGSRWRADGRPAAYYYDPPWTLPFLRRNEAVVAVEER